MICEVEGCERTAFVSSHGGKYTRCTAHIRALLSGAFRDPKPAIAWHERAREGTLPTQIVGGRLR